MFRDLACCTARLKGPRFEGAVIAAAEWSREGDEKAQENGGMPEILRDRHGMMTVRAADASGVLVLKMLLGRKAPAMRESGADGVLHLMAQAEDIGHDAICMMFTADEVRSFVHDVDDTNLLHKGAQPLVPGLLIMERLLKHPSLKGCSRMSMKFTTPVFVGQKLQITFAGDNRAEK